MRYYHRVSIDHGSLELVMIKAADDYVDNLSVVIIVVCVRDDNNVQ